MDQTPDTRTDELTKKPSLRVVEAVAAADETDPATLDPPLHAVVDPTALDRLFDPTSAGPRQGSVRFTYHDHDVTLRPDGTVTLD